MPIDPATVSLVTAGAGFLGDALGGMFGKSADKANRQFQLDMWNKQNEYNKPINQRRRMEEAGFAPQMAYGHGTVANTASTPPTSEVKSYVPRLDKPIQDYFTTKLQQQQLTNMETENQLKETDIFMRAIQAGKMVAETAKTDFERRKGETLLNSNVEMMTQNIENVKKRNLRMDLLNENYPKEVQAKIMEAYSRIQNNKSQITNRDLDSEIKRTELELRKLGFSFNDDLIYRLLGKYIAPLAKEALTPNKKNQSTISKAWKFVKDWF